MERTRLEIVWEVDAPTLGFAERVVGMATGAAFEAVDRPSGMVPRFLPRDSAPGHRLLRRALAGGMVVAAAAMVLCLFGTPTGQGSGRTSAAGLQAEFYGYPEGLADIRSSASGGNTAENPEAGATGLW